MTILTKKDVIARINAFCDKFDTFAEAAAVLRCTPSQLSQARLNRTGLIPSPILKKLKIRTVTLYESSEKPAKTLRKAVAPAKAKARFSPAEVREIRQRRIQQDNKAKKAIAKAGGTVTNASGKIIVPSGKYPAPKKPQPAPKALPARPEKGDTTPPPSKALKGSFADPEVQATVKKHNRRVRKPAALTAGYGQKESPAAPGDPYQNAAKRIYADDNEVIDDGDGDPQFNPEYDMPGAAINVFED